MKLWKRSRSRNLLLFISLFGAYLQPSIAFSADDKIKEKYKFVKFDPISDEEVSAYRKEILEKWPKSQWKTFYVCNWAEKEIFSFQAPKEAKWEQCNVGENNKIQKSSKGNECCYLDDFAPYISLSFSKGEFERKMNLKADIIDRQMAIKKAGGERKYKDAVKDRIKKEETEFRQRYTSEALKEFERFVLNGTTVLYISIEDWGYNSLQKSYHSLTFEFDGLGGQVRSSEFDKKSGFNDFTPLDQMVFTDLIKEIFKTAKILVPVKDWPEKKTPLAKTASEKSK